MIHLVSNINDNPMPKSNEKEKLAHVLMICNWMINA